MVDDDGKLVPISIYNILISTQHDPSVKQDEIKSVITEKIIKKVCPPELMKENTQIIINPSGSFVTGGP